MSDDAALLTATFVVDPFHPAFAGHFPGRPILPGVALLAEVMEHWLVQSPQALQAQWTFDAVKFLAPVGPGARLTMTVRARVRGHGFEVRHGNTLVASGQLTVQE
ncbi:MAG: 3-hydroxyacyl-ACP dehydratase [Pseudomonadota bacterium]